MKERISPRDTTPKPQRSERRQEEHRGTLRLDQPGWKLLDAASDRLLMDGIRAERLGPEYWLG